MENTAKNFALQLGSLIALYVSIGAFISLLLSTITVLYPDSAQMPYEYTSATSLIRYAIAMLVVFFPTYVILTRLVNTIRRTQAGGTYLTLTKWLIYLSLLIGGAVILGDLVAILLSFLNGEITIRFILKALAVLIVVGAAFTYYLLDAKGYWQTHEKDSIMYGIVVGILVLIAIVFGYTKIETPAEVRAINLDNVQINDLMMIQSRIESYARLEGNLPETIEVAYDRLDVPAAPEDRAAYTYKVVDATKFELCAEFASETPKSGYQMYSEPYIVEEMAIKNPNDWTHADGPWCFERSLNVQENAKPLPL